MMTAMSALYCGETTKTSVSSDICSQKKENYTINMITTNIVIIIMLITTMIKTIVIMITWALG